MKKVNAHLIALVAIISLVFGFSGIANAATTVSLGTADSFAVLAGTAVTDVPASVIKGDVGLSPAAGSNYAGLTSAEVTGTIYAVDASGPSGSVNNPALLTTAKNDLTTAYLDAAGRTPTTTYVAADNQLGGKTLTTGVYAFGHASTANLTGTLTLDGGGDATSVFIFQASSDLVTASSSVVTLTNGAQACNVFWQVTSSATLGTSSTFVGTIMALTSVGLNTSATLSGRALARNAAVTMDHNTITKPTCAVAAATSSAAASSSSSAASSSSSSSSAAAATTTPALPSTGLPPQTQDKSNRWDVAILSGIAVSLIAIYAIRRKKSA